MAWRIYVQNQPKEFPLRCKIDIYSHLSFDEVAYPDFGHHRDGYRINDFLDHLRVTLCAGKDE